MCIQNTAYLHDIFLYLSSILQFPVAFAVWMNDSCLLEQLSSFGRMRKNVQILAFSSYLWQYYVLGKEVSNELDFFCYGQWYTTTSSSTFIKIHTMAWNLLNGTTENKLLKTYGLRISEVPLIFRHPKN